MASPTKILLGIAASAVAVSGWFQAWHLRSVAEQTSPLVPHADSELENQLKTLLSENETLRRKLTEQAELPIEPQWLKQVETDLGLKFLQAPKILLATPETFRDRIQAATEMRYGPNGLDDREAAWKLLGSLDPEDSLLESTVAAQSLFVKSWFNDLTGEAFAHRQLEPTAIPDQAEIIRLLARILLHQHQPWPTEYPGDEVARSRLALHEGLATGCQRRFLTLAARNQGFMAVRGQPERSRLLQSLPSLVRDFTLFPFTEGTTFADSLYLKGATAVSSAISSPPLTTRQIFGLTPSSSQIEFPKLEAEALLEEQMGVLGLRSWLQKAGLSPDQALQLAASSLADRYQLVANGDALALRWDISFNREEDTAAFLNLLRQRTSPLLAAGQSLDPEKPSQTLEKRWIQILHLPNHRIRFLHTATSEMAHSLALSAP